VAKNEKSAAKASGAKAPAGQETGATTSWLYIVGAVVAAVLIGGIVYWRTSSDAGPGGKPDLAELMTPGPLPDISLGREDAPNTIVEYSSMTCPHCAQFHQFVLPELQTKYIDTGKARLIFREFPLDRLAAYANMLARCAGPDRFYPMLSALFETQSAWALPGEDGLEQLRLVGKQAGFTTEKFDQCIGDEDLFNKITETRTRGHETFGVQSTPTFFINGEKLTGEQTLTAFEAMLSEGAAPSSGAASAEEEPGSSQPEEQSGQ